MDDRDSIDIEEFARAAWERNAILAGLLLSLPVAPQANYLASRYTFRQETSEYIVYYGVTAPSFDQRTIKAILDNRQLEDQQARDRESFDSLVATWKDERRASSATTAFAMHPAYQEIIGMGEKALPFIFAELQNGIDHWFWALRAITRENPVPQKSLGNMQEMAKIWLHWGRDKGYVAR